MPTAEAVRRFTAQVLSGDHAGAIRDWYTEDASMQENQAEPRRGRDLLIRQEQVTLDRMERVETELLAPPLIDGDTVVIRWRFTFHPKAGGAVRWKKSPGRPGEGTRLRQKPSSTIPHR